MVRCLLSAAVHEGDCPAPALGRCRHAAFPIWCSAGSRSCPGLVHVITAYVAQYAALGEEQARRLLRPGIVRDADPGLREHELYAYYYDRVDQPAVAHESE